MKGLAMPTAKLASTAAFAAALAALVILSAIARAAMWPTHQVRAIVPFAAGSATDIVPRIVFERMQDQIGQTIVVENRPGGGGAVGVGAVAKSDPDGYTLLVHSNAFVTAPAIQEMPYDPVRDFAGITPLGNVPLVLVISPAKNIHSLKELVAAAKAAPGSINYAAAGIGSPPHLTAERFRLAAGFQGQLVPFKGAPEALTEVMTGRVDFYFSPLPAAIAFIRDGRLLALAVSGLKRTPALPDVPTTTEEGYADSDFDFWIGMVVPKKTPRDIVDRIHQATVAALEDSSVKRKLSDVGAELMIMTPQDFDQRIARETAVAVALAKAAGISAH
jgi:tripartite-type tricarboxylate transporter receptor subunit TctC